MNKAYWRGRLLSAFESKRVPTRLRVYPAGGFIQETSDWDSFWRPVRQLLSDEMDDCLRLLHSTWWAYIDSRFEEAKRRPYCYRYFRLIDMLLGLRDRVPDGGWKLALRTALGFECFGIAWNSAADRVLAGGTTTMRNPCYLLATLKASFGLDDSRFLPVITVPCCNVTELFYHYRQHALSVSSPLSILTFVAVSGRRRAEGFDLINLVSHIVGRGADPRAQERAKRLYRFAIHPLITAHKGQMTGTELVDVGAGTGSLGAALCKEIQRNGATFPLRVWSVDLQPKDTSRLFVNRRTKVIFDTLTFCGSDYRHRPTALAPTPSSDCLRIALVSKLLNNLSKLRICAVSMADLGKTARVKLETGRSAYKPTVCLEDGGAGPDSLIVPSAPVRLSSGRVYTQISLSEFFLGLYLLTTSSNLREAERPVLVLPVRAFDPDSLLCTNGGSLIQQLTESCGYVVIEDADLSPSHLLDHVTKFSIRHLAMLNMTKIARLKDNHLYLIWSRRKSANPLIRGEPIC